MKTNWPGTRNGHSGQVESLMFVGSTPTLVTAEWTGVWIPARSHKPYDAGSNPASATGWRDSPVVERKDAPLTRGRPVVRSHPGLLMGSGDRGQESVRGSCSCPLSPDP